MFQQTNTESFGDIAGVHIIADDMIIAAATKEEHDNILQQVMDRAVKLNVKFNADQIHLAQYIPHEATLTAPLRKDMMWQWHPEHQAALSKQTENSHLQHFTAKVFQPTRGS